MSARVTILLLAIGVFVAIWSGDRRRPGETQSTIAAHADGRLVDASGELEFFALVEGREEAKPGIVQGDFANTGSRSISFPAGTVRRAPRPMVAKRKHDPGTDLSRTRGVFPIPGFCDAVGNADSIADVPLPGGITPGEYRIVRSDGGMLRIRLTAEELARRGLKSTDSPRGHYLLHDGRMRWYFIRVEAPVSQVATGNPRTSVVSNDALPPVVAPKPRTARTVSSLSWNAVLTARWQSARDAAQAVVRATLAELARRGANVVDTVTKQLRLAAVRVRRVASEPKAMRR